MINYKYHNIILITEVKKIGSHCIAEFENTSGKKIEGSYTAEILNQTEEPVEYFVLPKDKFIIDMEFVDHSYFRFDIDAGELGVNYFEIRSIADFLLLQQVLIKKYKLKLISAQPHYKEFW